MSHWTSHGFVATQPNFVQQFVRSTEMCEISDMNDIALPSARKNYDEKSGGLAVGRVCAKIFSESNQIGVDHFIITRDISKDWDEANRKEREVKNYVFSHK